MTPASSLSPGDEPTEHIRYDHCPTCDQWAEFTYLGAQRWPQRLVDLTGVPPVIFLWQCGHCLTTLSEPQVDW
ncbi:MAG: hypothetical protein K8I60_16635 [Anaerolineae bacterium]|nr:hypothetical protein [Anaerolineae bacterium]